MKYNKEDLFTLDQFDLADWREYSLRPQRGKRTKAERAFDAAMDEFTRSNTDTRPRKYKQVTKKDWGIVRGLLDEYWRLQEDIENEECDPQKQRTYIDQQHDILEELEVVYKKYLKQ